MVDGHSLRRRVQGTIEPLLEVLAHAGGHPALTEAPGPLALRGGR